MSYIETSLELKYCSEKRSSSIIVRLKISDIFENNFNICNNSAEFHFEAPGCSNMISNWFTLRTSNHELLFTFLSKQPDFYNLSNDIIFISYPYFINFDSLTRNLMDFFSFLHHAMSYFLLTSGYFQITLKSTEQYSHILLILYYRPSFHLIRSLRDVFVEIYNI